MNNIAAIPTLYDGVQYRSRLEAKWAAFYDLLGWKWQYEPFDLNGWIPDFLLPGACPVLVEIKPITERDGATCAKITKAARDDGFGGDILLGGCIVPATIPNLVEGTAIGWLLEGSGTPFTAGFDWDAAVLGDYGDAGGGFGLCHAAGSYADRITGKHVGDHCFHHDAARRARQMWAAAGNLVQWKAA